MQVDQDADRGYAGDGEGRGCVSGSPHPTISPTVPFTEGPVTNSRADPHRAQPGTPTAGHGATPFVPG
eukprot:10424309-Prorocentrum_lima.AAC.1